MTTPVLNLKLSFVFISIFLSHGICLRLNYILNHNYNLRLIRGSQSCNPAEAGTTLELIHNHDFD